MSYLALSVNELTPEMEQTLPPTDTRFRKDIRCLEDGDIGKNPTPKNNFSNKKHFIKNKKTRF